MRGEFEAYFTAGTRTRTFTFTVTTVGFEPLPPIADLAAIARAQLTHQTELPVHNWTLVKLVDVTNEIGEQTKATHHTDSGEESSS